MSKKERDAFDKLADELRIVKAFRFTEPVDRDVPRPEGGCSILQFPTENINSEVGLTPAWTHSDPRLASLVAAWPTLPGAVRAALCELVTATQRRAA